MITGGRVVSVEATKKSEEQIQGMDVFINIDKLEAGGENLTISYTYNIDYRPGIASMKIRGEVLSSESNSSEIMEKWKKTGELPQNFTEELLGAITYTASAIGTLLAFSLNIAAPINIPRPRIQMPSSPSAS